MSTLVNRPKGDAQTAHAELFTPLRVGDGLSLSNRLAHACRLASKIARRQGA